MDEARIITAGQGYNHRVIVIRPIRPNETRDVKQIILSVAYRIFGWDGTFEDAANYFESSNEFTDIELVEQHYFRNNGLFLAVLDEEEVIGSGAIRKMDDQTAEIKRMWLMEQYHGQGIGYQVITQLLDFAKARGYTRVRLQTSPEQTRAITFYKRVGFYKIPCYNDKDTEVSMEIRLQERRHENHE